MKEDLPRILPNAKEALKLIAKGSGASRISSEKKILSLPLMRRRVSCMIKRMKKYYFPGEGKNELSENRQIVGRDELIITKNWRRIIRLCPSKIR